MAREVVTEIEIPKIFIDTELYPRSSMYAQTAYIYSQNILAGAVMPPIVLAKLDDKYYLVDGRHRIEAYKILKIVKIKAEVHIGWTRQKVFEEAVRRNVTHGMVLSPYDRRRVALKLRAMKYPESKISELIQVPLDKLQNFVAQRLVNAITGEVISEVVVKSGMRHMQGQSFEGSELVKLMDANEYIHIGNQIRVLEEIVYLLESGFLDLENIKIKQLISKAKKLFEQI